MNATEHAVSGCLIGMAVGDALGLPREGLSPRRSARLFPNFDRFYFLFGRGMFSDDTEHACMTGQALLVSGGDPNRFLRSLSWRLRWWLLGLPLSIGRATLLACLKLWFGWNGRESGVWSAGNGPGMRALILGVCFGFRPDRLRELVRISTRLTHSDPKAEWGALALAWAAHLSAGAGQCNRSPIDATASVRQFLPADAEPMIVLLERAAASVAANQSTEVFAAQLGLAHGVSGYMYHTVPIVWHAWLRNPQDYRTAVQEVIRCGGDADTTAALVGGIVGACVGKSGVPEVWRRSLCEWPRDLRWIERLGRELVKMLDDGRPRKSLPLSVPGIVARNFAFNMAVMGHVFRRMLPPY